jgi:alcohol dehydrogenase (cytochrome c)
VPCPYAVANTLEVSPRRIALGFSDFHYSKRYSSRTLSENLIQKKRLALNEESGEPGNANYLIGFASEVGVAAHPSAFRISELDHEPASSRTSADCEVAVPSSRRSRSMSRAKTLVAVCSALLLCISASSSVSAQDASGTWRSEAPYWWTSGWTVVLQVHGTAITGAVTNCPRGGAIEIVDGRIEGDTIRFNCRSEDGRSTMAFTGTLKDDQITFSWDLREPVPVAPPPYATGQPPSQFTVQRAPGSAGRLVLDRLAERIRTTRPPFTPVTFDRIQHSDREPQNWLTYSGTLQGGRYSQLTSLTPENVGDLDLAWVWTSQSAGRFEATPLVAEGVLYTVQAPNDVVALDAISGEVIWTFKYAPAPGVRATAGGGRPNRGLAMLGGQLFLGTLDAHLLAIDARTGKLNWNTTVADAADPVCKPPDVESAPCYVITHAPLVVKDKVIVGTGGGDGARAGYGIRGLIAAYDATTGQQVWRFHTIPGPGEAGHESWSGDSWKTGGAGVWQIGTYDPELNLTYWGVGNPVPTADGSSRLGDNLYSASVLALDADTGALRWHYQFTPHDEMDWDAAHVPVLTELVWRGRQRNVMLFANKNGLMYVVDRGTGELLLGKPFVETNWFAGFDEHGRPLTSHTPAAGRIPTTRGATNWQPTSFSPKTGLFYVSARERRDPGPGNGFGAVRAIDPTTGERRWQFVLNDALFDSGILTTASNLLFAGVVGDNFSGPSASRRLDGYFYALDAKTGARLWRTSLAGSVYGSPITYMAGRTQYVAISAGNLLFAFALRR